MIKIQLFYGHTEDQFHTISKRMAGRWNFTGFHLAQHKPSSVENVEVSYYRSNPESLLFFNIANSLFASWCAY